MGLKMAEYYYDEEQDILNIELDRNKHDSIPVGGLVIDLSNEGELAGIEIFNASKNISRYTGFEKDQIENMLENIEEIDVETKTNQGMMSIMINFSFSRQTAKMPINLQAPA